MATLVQQVIKNYSYDRLKKLLQKLDGYVKLNQMYKKGLRSAIDNWSDTSDFTDKLSQLKEHMPDYISVFEDKENEPSVFMAGLRTAFSDYDYIANSDIILQALKISQSDEIAGIEILTPNFLGIFSDSIMAGTCSKILEDYPQKEFAAGLFLSVLKMNSISYGYSTILSEVNTLITFLQDDFTMTLEKETLNLTRTLARAYHDTTGQLDYDLALSDLTETQKNKVKQTQKLMMIILTAVKNNMLEINRGTSSMITNEIK